MTDEKIGKHGMVWQMFYDQFECDYRFKPTPSVGWACATMRASCAATVKADKCPMKFSLKDVKVRKDQIQYRLQRCEERLDRLERHL